MAFDIMCYDLAESFLPDKATQAQINHLAQTIQDTIEDYLSDLNDEEALREESERG